MKKTLGILAFMCIFFLAYGQDRNYVGEGMIRVGSVAVTTGIEPSCLDASGGDSRNITNDINGYPFLVKGWGQGFIITKEREQAYDKLNFFFYNQQLWVKQGEEVKGLDASENVQAVVINGIRMISRVIPEHGIKPCWVEELEAGPHVLLCKYHTSKYTPASPPQSSYDNGTKAMFSNKAYLYASIHGEPMQELPEKTADFLKLFPQNAEALKLFLSKNKLNLKKEGDMRKAINYYNTL